MKLNEDEQRAVIKLYESGANIADITKQLNRSRDGVIEALQKAGLHGTSDRINRTAQMMYNDHCHRQRSADKRIKLPTWNELSPDRRAGFIYEATRYCLARFKEYRSSLGVDVVDTSEPEVTTEPAIKVCDILNYLESFSSDTPLYRELFIRDVKQMVDILKDQ